MSSTRHKYVKANFGGDGFNCPLVFPVEKSPTRVAQKSPTLWLKLLV